MLFCEMSEIRLGMILAELTASSAMVFLWPVASDNGSQLHYFNNNNISLGETRRF